MTEPIANTNEIVQESRDALFERMRELEAEGKEFGHAARLAWLEHRIREWPSGWGDDLHILIYGDFEPFSESITIDSLDITVLPGHVKDTVIRTAQSVQEAVVRVPEKSVPALREATRRINILLGVWALENLANASVKWWSWVTHDTQAAFAPVLSADVQGPTERLLALPDQVRHRFVSALYWIREPHSLMQEFPRADLLRQYAAFWNAFECLVAAVNEVLPRSKMSRSEKTDAIQQFFATLAGLPGPSDVAQCYRQIVDPGFTGKAIHALGVCFGTEANDWEHECFRRADEENRLYNIRNAINHGQIEAEDPAEAVRIDAQLSKLQVLVLSMFWRAATVAADGAPLNTAAGNS